LAILLYIFTFTRLWAANLESQYLTSLARARTGIEIERLRHEYSRLKVAQTACRIQLHEKTVPVSCYEAVELESAAAPRAEKVARLIHLDRLCAAAAARSGYKSKVLSPSVSRACAKKIAEARAIQNYRDGESADWSEY
jgi:hypothetical protein